MPQPTHFFYYLHRIKQLGFSGIKNTIKHRIEKKIFAYATKQKALKKRAHHAWRDLVTKYNLNPDFTLFFNQQAQQNFINKIATSPDFMVLLTHDYQSTDKLIDQADALVQNSFDLLGSGPTHFEAHHIPWQHDFKSHQTTLSDQSNIFYQEVTLPAPTSNINEYSADIKVPWELSRLQHIFVLGRAYQLTSNDTYALTFQNHVDDWITQNPYLLGVNWVCPMDVAIRAINLLWGFHFFKQTSTIPSSFWEKFICSLYDHAIYLENNWEWSDKPNNHYLADLLGYLYLCTFFKELPYFKKQREWCIITLLEQCDKQIQADGTSYEGSTAYHKLDTEMYLHFMLLCKAEGIALPPWVKQKFAKMILFLSDCTDAFGNLVTIGDDDSGKIVTGIKVDDFFKVACCKHRHSSNHSDQVPHLTTHENFGLSVIKKRNWHITFRHPTYTAEQPSGHFHQDHLAITVSIAGQPILVDPGSYVYTGNAAWRNIFRSFQSHNTFYLEKFKNIDDRFDLFQLPRATHTQKPSITLNDHIISLHDEHKEYAAQGINAHRTITFDGEQESITLEDWYEKKERIEGSSRRTIPKVLQSYWTFIFHPALELIQTEDKTWIITKDQKPLACLITSLPFQCFDGGYAPGYGIYKQTCILVATKNVASEQHEQSVIKRI